MWRAARLVTNAFMSGAARSRSATTGAAETTCSKLSSTSSSRLSPSQSASDSPIGRAVGAALLATLPNRLTGLKDYEMVVCGAVMMLTMIFMPKGFVPTLAARFAPRERK